MAKEIRPPFRQDWVSAVDLHHAVFGTNAIYGITNQGKIVALDPKTGMVRWTTSTVHIRKHLTVMGNTIYGYKTDDGLAIITDKGQTFDEKVVVSINPLTESDPVSNIVVDGSNIYMAVNEALLVLDHSGDLIAGTNVGSQRPYVLAKVASNKCVAVDGYGQPQMFELQGSTLKRLWYTTLKTPGSAQAERPIVIAGGVLITGANRRTCGFDLGTGALEWENDQIAAEQVLVQGLTVYAVMGPGHIVAMNVDDGETQWRRMYMYGTTSTARITANLAQGYLYVTAFVASGGPIHVFAVRTVDGEFAWQAGEAVLGATLATSDHLIVFGTSASVLALAPVATPEVTNEMIEWAPNPLRGPASNFAGALTINLPITARLNVRAIREKEGFGFKVVNNVQRGPGTHTFSWNAGGPGGFTSANQFGRLLVDIQEEGGPAYTLAQLVPVNTLPDLLGHWAAANIEIMVYNQFISGYPDLTFQPDNLITRAECSAIVANTLGLKGPSDGFQTKFTDIEDHWARNQITALEEKEIIGGFLEEDGTYTFRPNLNMTRAQKARILVKAYAIPPAPVGFRSNFTDVEDHWARPDIEALEAAGYVNGFEDDGGTFTYRPERHLTRAELSTVVVRIRKYTRP